MRCEQLVQREQKVDHDVFTESLMVVVPVCAYAAARLDARVLYDAVIALV